MFQPLHGHPQADLIHKNQNYNYHSRGRTENLMFVVTQCTLINFLKTNKYKWHLV